MSASTTGTVYPFGLTSPSLAQVRHGSLLVSGNVFFVSSTESGRADDVAHGKAPQTPFATLAYALAQCTANIGDLVILMEGHVETITTTGGVSLNVAGVTVIGLGNGENRPLLRLQGSTSASIAVSSSDITLQNVTIDATVLDGITNALTVNGEDFRLRDCDIYMADSLGQAVLGIVTTVNANRMSLERCRFWGTANAGANAFVKLVGANDGVTIRDCQMVGECAEALIWNDTGNIATNLRIENCVLRTLTGTAAIKLESACTGEIRNVTMAGTTLTSILDQGACAVFGCEGYDETLTDAQAVPLPANGTALAAGRSIYDELLGASLNASRLNSFVVTADFTSATWNTVAAHDIAVVTGACRVRIIPRCTDSLTSGGAPTMQLGITGETNHMILSTDPLSILTDLFWLSITPVQAVMYLGIIDEIVCNTTIGYEIFLDALTGGAIEFNVWWEPLEAGASVAAGSGASF